MPYGVYVCEDCYWHGWALQPPDPSSSRFRCARCHGRVTPYRQEEHGHRWADLAKVEIVAEGDET